MAEEQITVEWIATAKQMLETIQKVDKRIDLQEKAMQKLANTSKKGAEDAKGSFNKLEQELKENEAVLRRLTMGTQAFVDQRAKVDTLRASMVKLKGELTGVKTEVTALRTGESTFASLKTGVIGATGAAVSLVAILKQVADAQRDIVNTGADAAVELDTLARKFQIQAGLNDPERQAATVEILKQSSAAGVKAESGFQAATQLAGSGFDNAIESGALQTVLDTMQAGSFQGDAAQLVAAFSQVMNASGIEKTNANLKEIAVAAQSLFKKTDFQLTDLSEFAAIGATMKSANVDINEGIAAFTTLRDALPAGESATGLRNLVTKMQKGDVTAEGKKDLERLGVKAEDVDFVGESLTQVLTNLKTATDKMGEADRNAALGKLFGTENVTTARMLINSVPRIQELQQQQKNANQFEVDRATAAGGMQAGRNRLQNQELIEALPRGQALNQLDMDIRRMDQEQRAREQRAAVEIGPVGATAVKAGGSLLNTIDVATGADTTGGAMRGEAMSSSFGFALAKWFMSSDDKQDELIRLQREANELQRANAQRPAAPQRAQQLRAAGPGERVLPGALPP